MLVSFFACKKNDKLNSNKYKPQEKEAVEAIDNDEDSLTISVAFTERGKTGFNIIDENLNSFYLQFNNSNPGDSLITKRVSKPFKFNLINFLGLRFNKKEFQKFRHYYVLDERDKRLDFKFNKGDVILLGDSNKILADSLFSSYNSFFLKNKTNSNFENLLRIFYLEYENKFKFHNKSLELNKLLYVFYLQKNNPFHKSIDKYFENIKNVVGSKLLNDILYQYVSDRISRFNFSQINKQRFSENYIDLLASGITTYLSRNKTVSNYNIAFNWLKNTQFYKNNKEIIDTKLNYGDTILFSNSLKEISILDSSLKSINFSSVVNQNSADFYLLDFWATWCAPCINGINKLKELNLPDNVKVINLSIDKMSAKEKWQNQSKKLDLNISYLFDDKKENKNFIRMINLNAIPRYIIIDRNFNLIDINFVSPSNSNFLKRLNNLSQNK
ncbi:TlpA family protein disulfide reductase [uncultured Salegentibacter sp.]|uniref:TlpA family protein disulfide reductase n=1 Tax=uncultured Salegentibacter sp. TaxID=259320 RepID=UPI0025927097|nr:TlpA family protein disulfide reductase [uncultured Salegentibacter sp.]